MELLGVLRDCKGVAMELLGVLGVFRLLLYRDARCCLIAGCFYGVARCTRALLWSFKVF